MLNVSNDFNEAYKNYEREIKMRIKIKDVMYTDHDISSFSVDYGSFMGNSFGIGSTFTNSMKLTLCKIVEGLKQLDEVVPEMGIVMPDKTVEYVPLGVFVISEEVNIDRNDNKTVIECSDRMILMNEPYESKLKYPAPIRDVALEIANLSGMEVDKTSFSTIKRDVIDEPKNYTYREALGLVAQFMAGYMTFDRNGLLTIRYLVDKDYRITPKEYMLKGLEKNEILFRPAGIEVRTGQNEEDIMTVGKQKGSVIKLENTVMRRLLLDDMYTRIKDINFYPYTLKWRGNPAVEVGDWLRVTDTKGNVFKVPNLSYRLEYRGGLIATSTVETVASNEVKMGYRGVLDQTIHYVNNILEDGTGNHIYYGVEKPEYPKEGDTWFKKNGPDTEIYIYQKVAEPDVFDWVLQISSAVDDTIKEAIEELEKDVQNAKDKADEVAVGLVDVQKDADEAKANAEQAKIDASKAITDANKATQDAATSMINAKEALDKATSNETTIGGLQVDIDETKNELSSKANQTDVNKLQGTVTNQQTQITQNATDIKTKAEKSEVDTINNTVKNQQTEINQNAEQIKLKANQNVVDDINKKVTSQQAQIEVNKNNINLKANQTEVDNVKQTVSKQGSQIDINTSNIKLKAEKTEVTNLKEEIDSIERNNRNYFLRSDDIKQSDLKLLGNAKVGWFKKTTIEGYDFDFSSWYIDRTTPDQLFGFISAKSGNYTDEFYTNSIYVKNDGIMNIYVVDNSGQKEVVLPGEVKRVILTRKFNSNIIKQINFENTGTSAYLTIARPKIEKGKEVTPWSLAPEDLASQSEVTSLSSSIDIQANQIKNLVTKTDGHTTQLASLTIESDRISQQVTSLEKQKVGGGNLIPFTDEYWEKGWYDDKGNKIGAPHHYRLNKVLTIVKNSNYYIQSSVRVVIILVSSTGETVMKHDVKSNSMPYKFNSGSATNGYIFILEPTDPLPPIGDIKKYKIKLEKSDKLTDYSLAVEDMATQSQITQLSDDILLRVQKGDVINQINVSTEGVLIQGKKIHITGQTKIDNAVIKDAMIASMTANKLTAGTINANEIAVINVKADNIVSGTLNGIYINLDKAMTIAENGQIVSSYDYGDDYGNSYNPRWFDGTSRYGNRYLNFLSNVYDVNSNNTRGKFRHYTETFVGSDLFKMRQYSNTSNLKTPISHLDITSDRLLAGKGWGTDISISFEKGEIYSSSYVSTTRVESSNGEFTQGLTVRSDDGLHVGRINALSNYNTLIINNKRLDLGDLELSKDSSGRRIQSYAVYSRTYGGGATVTVTDAGTLGRITSAAKYKLDIEDADTVIDNAFKVLEINPRMWFDKTEVESIAKAMTNGNLKELEADRKIRRHHGFVADEFHEKGLDEVVIYDSKGEIEGLSYDRISMYHNVILKRQQDEIETLKRQVAELIGGGDK